MDIQRLRALFERLDRELQEPAQLDIRGGAAVLALGLAGRSTADIDVLPSSRFVEHALREACERAGLLFNPPDKDLVEADYIELVPEETLVLPRPSPDLPYNTVFRGRQLTVRTPPAADIIVGKLKRLDPEDLEDVAFLIRSAGLTERDLTESFGRLPARFQRDPVVSDNLRYVLEDYFGDPRPGSGAAEAP